MEKLQHLWELARSVLDCCDLAERKKKLSLFCATINLEKIDEKLAPCWSIAEQSMRDDINKVNGLCGESRGRPPISLEDRINNIKNSKSQNER